MEFKILEVKELNPQQRQQIAKLCFSAFDEDPWSQYLFMQTASHLVGILDGKIVSHALWTDRVFTINNTIKLKTAYVEYVTTDERIRGKGFASQLLRYLIDTLTHLGYELAALRPEYDKFYKKLGWINWLGDLYIHQGKSTYLTDENKIMLYPLNIQLKDLLLHSTEHHVICTNWREGELW